MANQNQNTAKNTQASKKVNVKFLKNGMPFGWAYPAGEIVMIELSKKEFDKLTGLGVITKV